MIALEYKKGSKDYVFIMVQGTPDYAGTVTEFIRKTLEEGGISPKDSAKQILMADELFALCCRGCVEKEAEIKVACAILQDERAIHLRMFAPLGGKDPLRGGDDPSSENAAAYIRGHTQRAAFESGIDRDMVEIVSALS